jgi:hypothetical protein
MKTNIKPLMTALVLAGLGSVAQAAHFERVDYFAAGGYSATTNAISVDDTVNDTSPASGTVSLSGSRQLTQSLGNGSLTQGYSADAALSFSTASTYLAMTLSQTLAANASGALSVSSHQQDAFLDLSSINLKIVGQGGEANGSAVQVSFAGAANALYNVESVVSGGYLGLGMSVSRGNTVVGEYFWDVQQSGLQPVNFSFTGTVGEQLTFSSFMLTGAMLENASFVQANTPYALVDASATLNGNFTIAAVPEPESYAMLLAGLGLVGAVARRRVSVPKSASSDVL